jgi:putative transposase
MSQSLARMLVHTIYSTRDRRDWISPRMQQELGAYLAGLLRNQGCRFLAAAVQPDHAHVLLDLSRTQTIARIVEELKTGSTKWIKRSEPRLTEFSWQDGYAAFSVSESNCRAVRIYFAAQRRYHASHSFQDELRELLILHDVAFDERYLWR